MLSLSDAGAVGMAALAEHAQPGPWGPTTHRYGPFFGIRENGRLLAMAGQRMLMPGMAEVSGVATWEDCRGRGYARAVIGHVMRALVARLDEHTSELPSLMRTTYAVINLKKKKH